MVYDRRGRESLWGPFLDEDAQVIDWESLEAVQYVFKDKMQLFWYDRRIKYPFNERWKDGHFRGVRPNSFIYESKPVEPPRETSDPYNITGTWSYIACGLKSHEFDDGPPKYLEYDIFYGEAEEEETCLHSRMELRVVEVRHSNTEGKSLPEVRFVGLATLHTRGYETDLVHGIQGTVTSLRNGEVKCSLTASGKQSWLSQGVQIGGRNSVRGVLGIWHDPWVHTHSLLEKPGS
ncbi:MAG: hypothetical protein Q9212_001724 [Teloschistes hypoglaucus]